MSYLHDPYYAISTNYRYGCRCPICVVDEQKRYKKRKERLSQPEPPVRLLNGPATDKIIKVSGFVPTLRIIDEDNVFIYGSSTMTVLPDGNSTVGYIYLRSEPLETAPREPAPI